MDKYYVKCLRDLVAGRQGWMAGLVTTETSGLNTINFANYKISLLTDKSCIKISLCQPGDNTEFFR